MKFLQDKSLRLLGALVLTSMFVLYFAEYLVVRLKINALEEIEQKRDFARSTELASQQLALKLQFYLSGQKELLGVVAAGLDHQDHLLKILGDGGRIDGTEIFLKPLSRLPRISYDNLKEVWNKYKLNAQIVLTEKDITEKISASLPDSLQAQKPLVLIALTAKTFVSGRWLSLSNGYEKILTDLDDEIVDKEASVSQWFIFFVLIDIALLGLVYFLFIKYVLTPINQLKVNTANYSHTHGLVENEMGKLASQINNTIEQLKDATNFVESIGEGKLELRYQELDSQYVAGKNKLADSLVSMQSKLKALNDEEQKRQWSNEGLAKFVDILRSSNDNIHALGDKIISALVHYTHSNQGGLYSLNDDNEDNRHLELISLFAFDTKKFESQRVKLGEGILGQAFLEKETTYISEIPEDYIRITSGLGDANPKYILMVPLKVDKEVYGIVELASFKEYLPHEIAFVEKLGETIASTLASVKSAQRNRQLIEQFQAQTEEMRAQEEEMRQNMEELTATQEEMTRKEHDYVTRIQQLELQTQGAVAPETLAAAKEDLARKEHDYHVKIQALESKLKEKAVRVEDDWQVAEEVAKALKINLEALKITREELE